MVSATFGLAAAPASAQPAAPGAEAPAPEVPPAAGTGDGNEATAAEAPPTAPARAPASAQPAAPGAEAPAPRGPNYLVAMLITDLVAMGGLAASATLGGSGALTPDAARSGIALSMLGYIGSGVLYHEMFDVRRKSLLSLTVRTLAPAVFALSGAMASTRDEEACHAGSDCGDDPATGALVGALFGMLGATVVEATMLVPEGRTPRPAPTGRSLVLTPTAAVTRSQGTVGLAARF